jgi:hypothetical protein
MCPGQVRYVPILFGGELAYHVHSVDGMILANGRRVLRGAFAPLLASLPAGGEMGHFRLVRMTVGDKSTFPEYVASGQGSVRSVVGYFHDQT